MDIIPKPKSLNLEKLKGLSDQELELRIKASAEKVAKKRDRYNASHALNMARLKAYESYRSADCEACRKLLIERKAKSDLPKGGNTPVQGKAV